VAAPSDLDVAGPRAAAPRGRRRPLRLVVKREAVDGRAHGLEQLDHLRTTPRHPRASDKRRRGGGSWFKVSALWVLSITFLRVCEVLVQRKPLASSESFSTCMGGEGG